MPKKKTTDTATTQQFEPLPELPDDAARARVWAFASGKGGVGKSLITANLAIFLATKKKRQVVVVDADFGSPNLHTFFGKASVDRNLSEYLEGDRECLDDVLVETDLRNLRVLSSSSAPLNLCDLSPDQKRRLLKDLPSIDADYILLDLAAGTNCTTLDIFSLSDLGVIVVVPEPPSIENAYRFLKSQLFHIARHQVANGEAASLVEASMREPNPHDIQWPMDLLDKLRGQSKRIAKTIEARWDRLRIRLVLNQIRSEEDIEIGHAIELASRTSFGIDVQFAGYIDYDFSAWQAVQERKNLIVDYPSSMSTRCLEAIGERLSYLTDGLQSSIAR